MNKRTKKRGLNSRFLQILQRTNNTANSLKYTGAVWETNMFLPEIDFVLYLRRKGRHFLCLMERNCQNTNFISQKVEFGTHKLKKMTKSEFTEVDQSLLLLKSIANLGIHKIWEN